MTFFLSWILIPGLTFLLPGKTNWFTTNFSVAGSMFPQNLILLSWGILTGIYFRTFFRHAAHHAAAFLSAKRELALVNLAVFLLIFSHFLPYRPEQEPVTAFLHLALAFSATVLFFFAVTSLDLRLYFLVPDLFSFPTAMILVAIAGTICLLILCDFIITSALEIFLTLFSCQWLYLFDRQVQKAAKRYGNGLPELP